MPTGRRPSRFPSQTQTKVTLTCCPRRTTTRTDSRTATRLGSSNRQRQDHCRAPDSDGDEMKDRWEAEYGLDPTDGAYPNGGADDPDADSRSNVTRARQLFRSVSLRCLGGSVEASGHGVQLRPVVYIAATDPASDELELGRLRTSASGSAWRPQARLAGLFCRRWNGCLRDRLRPDAAPNRLPAHLLSYNTGQQRLGACHGYSSGRRPGQGDQTVVLAITLYRCRRHNRCRIRWRGTMSLTGITTGLRT